MPVHSIRSWLGLDRTPEPEHPVLRDLVEALDRLDPVRARYLARFAYLLGRVAYADREVSPEETKTMERLVVEEGQVTADQAMLVVQMATTTNRLFGGTADHVVVQEFAAEASYEQKLSLARCLFALAAADESISMSEETEIHRIVNQLRIESKDLTTLRIRYRRFLPGMS